MTKIDVREMEAGPELDAACARAMGLCPHIWEIYEPPEEYCDECGAMLSGWVDEDRPEKRCKICGKRVWGLRYSVNEVPDCKHYSRDIAAAWELVEAILDQDDQQKWLVFADLLYGHTPILAPEYLAALRICQAFLLASGVTEIEVDDAT